MAIFYHVSPTPIRVGEYIEPRKEVALWRKEEDGASTYACLAPNIENVIFWIRSLERSCRMRDVPERHDAWYIHTVEVPDDYLVELCADGVYYNFARGVAGTAGEIAYLRDDIPTDSEVVVTEKVAKVVNIDTFLIPKEWWDEE